MPQIYADPATGRQFVIYGGMPIPLDSGGAPAGMGAAAPAPGAAPAVAPTGPPAPAEGFLQNVKSGFASAVGPGTLQGLGGAVEAGGELTGSDLVKDYFTKPFSQSLRDVGETLQSNIAQPEELSLKNFREDPLGTAGSFIGTAGGSVTQSAAPVAVLGLLGSIFGPEGTAIGLGLGTYGPELLLNFGDNYDGLVKAGQTDKRLAAEIALAAAVPQSLVSKFGVNKLIGGQARELVGKYFPRVAARIGQTGAEEAGEEIVQGGIQEAATAIGGPNYDPTGIVGRLGLQGALGATGGGAFGGAYEAARSPFQTIAEPPPPPPPPPGPPAPGTITPTPSPMEAITQAGFPKPLKEVEPGDRPGLGLRGEVPPEPPPPPPPVAVAEPPPGPTPEVTPSGFPAPLRPRETADLPGLGLAAPSVDPMAAIATAGRPPPTLPGTPPPSPPPPPPPPPPGGGPPGPTPIVPTTGVQPPPTEPVVPTTGVQPTVPTVPTPTEAITGAGKPPAPRQAKAPKPVKPAVPVVTPAPTVVPPPTEAAAAAKGSKPTPAAKGAKPAAVPATDTTGMASMGSGMAQAISQGLRDRLFAEYEGRESSVDPRARRIRKAQPGMNRDQFVAEYERQWREGMASLGSQPTGPANSPAQIAPAAAPITKTPTAPAAKTSAPAAPIKLPKGAKAQLPAVAGRPVVTPTLAPKAAAQAAPKSELPRLDELSADTIDDFENQIIDYDKRRSREILGGDEKRARRYLGLSNTYLNSSDPTRSAAAEKTLSEEYSPKELEDLEQALAFEGPPMDIKELREIRNALDDVADAETSSGPETAADIMGWAVRQTTPQKIRQQMAGEINEPGVAAQTIRMRGALADLKRRGVSESDRGRMVIEAMTRRGMSEGDAVELASDFIKPTARVAPGSRATAGREPIPRISSQPQATVLPAGAKRQAVSLMTGAEPKPALIQNAPKGVKKAPTRLIAEAIIRRAREMFGIIERDDRTEKTRDRIAGWMVQELTYELSEDRKDQSGAGWYSWKYKNALKTLGQLFPEFDGKMPEKGKRPGVDALGRNPKRARDFFTLLLAITSDGQEAGANFQNALQLYDGFRRTGRVPTDFTFGGDRVESMQKNAGLIQELHEKYRDKLIPHLMEEATVKELKALATAEGDKFSTSYPVQMRLPRSAILFGPKLGAFSANLLGAHGYLTMDRWWSRTFNRYRGQTIPQVNGLEGNERDESGNLVGLARFKQLIGKWNDELDQAEISDSEAMDLVRDYTHTYSERRDEKGRGYKHKNVPGVPDVPEEIADAEKAANTIFKAAYTQTSDQPFNMTDRQFMYDTAVRAAEMMAERGQPISVADVQATLWYFEKRLYAELGARRTQSRSYGEIAEELAKRYAGSDAGAGIGAAISEARRLAAEGKAERARQNVASGKKARGKAKQPVALPQDAQARLAALDDPEVWVERGKDVQRSIRDLVNRITGGRAKLDIQGRLVASDGAPVTGAYLRGIIHLALNDPANPDADVPRSLAEVLGTARHEGIHFLREVGAISPAEWKTLVKRAAKWRQQLKIDEAYADMGLTEDELIEEAIAEAYARWGAGTLPKLLAPNTLFEKIKAFLEGLRQSLRRSFGGLPTAGEIFAAIEAGTFADRGGAVGSRVEQMYALPAWHGTEPDFDQFSLNYGFTGEGTQAFGRGLYMASKKEVGEYYRDLVTAQKGAAQGRLYKVELGFDNDDIIDWDEPLAKQPAKIREVFDDLLDPVSFSKPTDGGTIRVIDTTAGKVIGRITQVPGGYKADKGGQTYKTLAQAKAQYTTELTGSEAYRRLSIQLGGGGDRKIGDSKASQALLKAGIPGHRYLDQQSRGIGEGTHNYVVYDDALVRIEAKYQRARLADTRPDFIAAPTKTGLAKSFQQLSAARNRGGFWKETVLPSLVRNLANQLDPFARIDVRRWGKIPADKTSLFKTAELHMQDTGRFEQMAFWGVPFWNAADGLIDIDESGGGLVPRRGEPGTGVFNELQGGPDYNKFQGFIVANRAKRLITEGREHLMTQAQIDQALDVTADERARYERMIQRYNVWNGKLLQVLVDTGTIKQKDKDVYAQHMDYVPFYRVIEDSGEMISPNALRKGFNNPDPRIKKLLGGTDKIGDVFENIAQNARALVTAAGRNVTAAKARETLVFMGEADDGAGNGAISYFDNGQKKYFRPHDPAVYAALAAQPAQNLGALYNFMTAASGAFRAGITSTPVFLIRNLLRGSAASFVQTGMNVSGKYNTATGLMNALKNKPSVRAIKAASGTGGYRFGAGSGAMSGTMLRRAAGVEQGNYIADLARRSFEILQHIGEATEFADRDAVYNNYLAAGATRFEATYQAMNVVNYGRKGAAKSLQFIIPLIPFLNPRIQGLYRMFENHGDRSVLPGIMLRGALLMAASMGLWAFHAWDDDEWEKYQAEDLDRRVNNWIVYTDFFGMTEPKKLLIPKPFEFGALFATIPEAMTEAFFTDKGDRELGSVAAQTVLNTFGFNPIPQIVLPAVEVAANYDFFRTRPLESMSDQRLPPSQRATSYTSGVARAIGSVTGSKYSPITLSPIEIQHLIEGYLGTVGSMALAGTDAIAGAGGVMPSKPTGAFGSVWGVSRAAEIGFGGLVRDEDVDTANQWVNQLYDLKEEADQVYAGARQMRANGELVQARKLIAENRGLLGARGMLDKAGAAMAELSRELNRIRTSKLGPDEMRAKLAPLIKRRNELAKRITEATQKRIDLAEAA